MKKKKTSKDFCVVVTVNTVRVIKYRRLRWAVHVARIEEGRNAF